MMWLLSCVNMPSIVAGLAVALQLRVALRALLELRVAAARDGRQVLLPYGVESDAGHGRTDD